MTLTTRQLIDSLRGDTCLACEQFKRPGHTFCGICYRSLPPDMRRKLYRRVGSGYEDAMTAALQRLRPRRETEDRRAR